MHVHQMHEEKESHDEPPYNPCRRCCTARRRGSRLRRVAAGLSPAEARGLSLNEIAVAKFNRDVSGADRQRIVTPGSAGATGQLAASAGLSPDQADRLSVTEIAAAKFSRDTENAHDVVRRDAVTAITRSVGASDRGQLAAVSGLNPDEARSLSLTEIARAKFARDTYN
jgi:hypothetical protein